MRSTSERAHKRLEDMLSTSCGEEEDQSIVVQLWLRFSCGSIVVRKRINQLWINCG